MSLFSLFNLTFATLFLRQGFVSQTSMAAGHSTKTFFPTSLGFLCIAPIKIAIRHVLMLTKTRKYRGKSCFGGDWLHCLLLFRSWMREAQWTSYNGLWKLMLVFQRWTGNKSTPRDLVDLDHVCSIVRWLRRTSHLEEVGLTSWGTKLGSRH